MEPIHAHILRLLAKKESKPGELVDELGISRQTLHKHLRILIEQKKIRKRGAGPHVVYSVMLSNNTTSRVLNDYKLCLEMLLPQYLHDFARPIERYIQRLSHGNNAAKGMDFGFLLDAAAVYSSNIEGNTLDLNSFLNSRTSPKKHRPKEAQEIEDLVSAYEYVKGNKLTEKNMLHAHKMLSRQFVAKTRQGVYRQEPVGVFSRHGLEYMAVEPHLVAQEMHTLFTVVSRLLHAKQSPAICLFWAAWLHLMIALIHPFSDGNGRTARLCEKWFLMETLGEQMIAVSSEELYWKNRSHYYAALKLGVNYWEADMKKAFEFFALLPKTLLK